MGVCETCTGIGDKPKMQEAPLPQLLEKTNLSYMDNCICKINGNTIGTGFFCKIEYNKRTIPVLMTNYHVINDKYLEINEYLKVYIKNDSHIININKDSKIYSSERYDIMIIKLNNDNKDIKNYLEIDSNIYKRDSLSRYKKENIYILHYPNSQKPYISYGNGIKKEGQNNIKHMCSTQSGSSGAPILSSLTHKVIGIHKAHIKSENISYNMGTFLKYPLDELKKINK